MYHPTPALLVAALLARPQLVRGQGAHADSTFLTGSCPTQFADSVKWDNVVTVPDQPARMLPESRPQFPVYLRRDGYDAKVVLGMVIDTLGRVMPGTVSVTASTDPKLSAWVCMIAFELRYAPARVANKPVNALSEQPLSFAATVTRLPSADRRNSLGIRFPVWHSWR
jgi:hypothetical protein